MQFPKSSPSRLNSGFPSFRARRRGSAADRQKLARRRLAIEMLEDRAVPASLTINANTDGLPMTLPNRQAIVDTIDTATRILDGFLITTNDVTVNVNFSVMQSSISKLVVKAGDGGSGYDPAHPPLVTIDPPGGGGTQAVATAIVTGGVITGFNWNPGTHGSGYTAIPNVLNRCPTSRRNAGFGECCALGPRGE